MNLKNMKKEELESLSYTDIAEIILKENKKPMNTPNVFKKICELLELSEQEYSEKIGDFYTSLTTDKRFILLDTAEWDLKDKHKVEIILDEEDDEEILDEEELEETEESEDEENESIEITDDEVDLDDSDDFGDLSIVDDEDLEEDM